MLQHPWLAAHAPKARKITSVTRWLVSTLPPTTAAWPEGDRKDPLGMITVIGARQPWFRGMSCEIRARRV